MKYNPAEAYALAIGHLADRLRGGAPIVQAWPREERVLTRAERLRIAAASRPRRDSTSASRTAGSAPRRAPRCAISRPRSGLVPDGFATVAVLERLRGADNANACNPVAIFKLTFFGAN